MDELTYKAVLLGGFIVFFLGGAMMLVMVAILSSVNKTKEEIKTMRVELAEFKYRIETIENATEINKES